MTDTNWKDTAKKWLHLAGKEVKKTTKLGQKMLHISKINGEIEDLEKGLGKVLIDAIKKGELNWDNKEVLDKISKFDELVIKLQDANREIDEIKKDKEQ